MGVSHWSGGSPGTSKAAFTLGIAQALLADRRGGILGAALALAASSGACGVGTPRCHLLRPASWKPAACPTLTGSQAVVTAVCFTSALFGLAEGSRFTLGDFTRAGSCPTPLLGEHGVH